MCENGLMFLLVFEVKVLINDDLILYMDKK